MTDLTEQQMRALELRGETLRHLSTAAMTLAGAVAALAGTVLQSLGPSKLLLAAGLFLFTALASLLAQEQLIRAMETGKGLGRKIELPTMLAQGAFGMGWAVLVYQGLALL